MKYLIAIVVSLCMWFVADLICDNHIQSGSAAYWREVWIFAMGAVVSAILN